MKSTIAIAAAFLAVTVNAQSTLPAVPDTTHLPELGYWYQPKPQPNLAASAAVTGFCFLLSGIFANSNARNMQDFAPTMAVSGLVFGGGVLALEIGTTKERKWIKRELATR